MAALETMMQQMHDGLAKLQPGLPSKAAAEPRRGLAATSKAAPPGRAPSGLDPGLARQAMMHGVSADAWEKCWVVPMCLKRFQCFANGKPHWSC